MALVAQPGTPLSIPHLVPMLLWPALVPWALFLVSRRRRRAWPCSWRFGLALIPGCLFADAAALLAAMRWPTPDASAFVFTVLWVAALFSLTIFFALRAPDDAGGDDAEPDEEYPEPPWWPDFERDLRDYMRRPPRAPGGSRPRETV